MLGSLEFFTRIVAAVYSFFFAPDCGIFRDVRFTGHGKRVLVSGCDSGIGLRTAERLHKAGYQVLAGCLSDQSDGAKKLSLLKGPHPVVVLQLDITKQDSVREALKKAEVQEKGLWGLVNNAGVCVLGEFEWMTQEQVEHTFGVNVLGTLRLSKACLPYIRKSKGRLVTITTVMAVSSFPGMSVYCASKFALETFCDVLRIELSRHGAHASVIRPGDLVKHTRILEAQKSHAQDMWNGMDSEQQSLYEPYMAAFISGRANSGGMLGTEELDDSPVFGHIEHALGAARPRARYMSDKSLWPVFLRFLALLPTTLSDALQSFCYRVIFLHYGSQFTEKSTAEKVR
ncbi:hypothetical protein HPB47_010716 [Ixodes persulcatus]|uniref:Uncharacterized protein n=1 Tax=Ixodes persulcatus TaxID=34615 RepID=A0AC60NYL3_IXOPE|nr:hypothetical protein HPB47_010716 [Ixodes persulcatus]